MKSFRRFGCYVLLSLLVAGTERAHAASDGTLGTTSTGQSDLSVTIANLVRITNVGDLAFGTYNGTGDLNQNDNVCIFRNDVGGSYRVTITSSEGAFQVESGANTIDYSVFWNDATGTSGEIAITYNTPTATQTGADTASQDCTGGSALNANFHVQMVAADLLNKPAGTYTGTLIMLVEPV